MQHLTMQHLIRYGFPAALAMFGLAACADVPTSTKSSVPAVPTASVSAGENESENGKHIITFSSRHAPADFAARVTARDGTVDEILDGPGLAIVSGLTAAAADELSTTGGIDAVGADMRIQMDAPEESANSQSGATAARCSPETDPANNSVEGFSRGNRPPDKSGCYAYQWNMRAIEAEAAWHAGYLGSSDVTVYLLDTGIDYGRSDLKGRVDFANSTSKVPAPPLPEPGKVVIDEEADAAKAGVLPFMDFHSHGTAVASTIVSNGVDLAGVSKKTTIVAVKVLDRSRVGLETTFIEGINYAADHRADIIHLSLSFPGFRRTGNAARIAAIDAATTYAHKQGAVIVVAAGNAGQTVDGEQWRFCNAKYVICVSATGPTALGASGLENVDAPAAYTNFGNAITVAGPGGSDFPNLRVLVNCSRYSLVQSGNPLPCSTGAPRFETVGTTFSAAVTSGLLALIISRVGHGQPARVCDVLINSANDLGLSGPDPYYGMGRINVARAMGMLGDRKEVPFCHQ